jgi:uncharacterized protein
MDKDLRKKLLNVAESKIAQLRDPSHDINHTLRVLSLAEKIAIKEKADLDIVIASAIFHDVIVYPKNHIKRLSSSVEFVRAFENELFAKKNLTDDEKKIIEVLRLFKNKKYD